MSMELHHARRDHARSTRFPETGRADPRLSRLAEKIEQVRHAQALDCGAQRDETKICTDQWTSQPPGRLLTDWLLRMDEARNARPQEPQEASQMVKERNARLADQAEKIAALKRAREEQALNYQQEKPWRKRELIDTGTDKRYVRRNKLGTSFVKSDDVGRSLAADRRKRAKTKVKSGEGDKGDRPRPKSKAASKGRKKVS